MMYGQELIKSLEQEIASYKAAIKNRYERIENGFTDMEDCFVSQRFEERGIRTAEEKIALIRDGGCAWFTEYATLDNQLIDAHWCETRYGYSLRAVMPDGRVVWTTANTEKGLAKKGIKKVMCKRPAWFVFRGSGSGLWGAYNGSYVLFPSDINYATGEPAPTAPIEIAEFEY